MEEVKVRSRSLYRAIGLALALLLGSYFVFQIPQIVLLFLLTLLFAIVLSGPVNYLAQMGLPRGLGVLVVLGGLFLALWLAGRMVTPIIAAQAGQFVSDFPTLLTQVQDLISSSQSSFGLESGTSMDPQSLLETGRDYLSENVSSAVSVGRSLVEAVSLGVVAFIVTVYLVVQPAQLVSGFVSFFPAGQRERVREVLSKMYQAVQKWAVGQLSAMVLIGVLTAIALSIIGIPYALFIGALSGLLAFIPLVGALISVLPPVLLALATDPILAVWVVISYILIHQIEAHLIQPLVMSRAVSLHPVVVVFAILIMGTLFGFVGLLLAVPLVAALSVLVHELWVSRMNQMGVDPHPPTLEKSEDEALRKTGLLRRALNLIQRSR
ncbi:MAG: AI-2E family transporter [Actinobacteria bacterium]|nr:AI-2E family transporter [Actinomycetota bacterium]MCA1737981.1 AI-2E family transporter [Actinomycetota bacterium]